MPDVSVLDALDSANGRLLPRYLALGCALWAVGIAAAHVAAPFGCFGPSMSLPLLLITWPLAWLTVRLVARLSGDADRLVQAVGLVSMPALLLDGLALTWAPSVYSVDEAERRAASAWLLWFVGVSLVLALWRASQQTARHRPADM